MATFIKNGRVENRSRYTCTEYSIEGNNTTHLYTSTRDLSLITWTLFWETLLKGASIYSLNLDF